MKNKTTNEGEGLVSPYLLLNMDALHLNSGKSNVTQNTMKSIGLTEDAIEDLLECRYNKIRNMGSRSIWNYDGYESNSAIELYIRQGDGSWALTAYACIKNKNTGLWQITMEEI